MATLNQTGLPTLYDVVSAQDPDGKIARIAKVLEIATPLLQDIPWYEANGPDGHLLTLQTGLPALSWRQYNQGILPTKMTTGQFTESMGMLDGLKKIDVALAERNGNAEAYRAKQFMGFVASYNRTLETAFFYESTKTNPERIMGLSGRLDALTGIPYASQVLAHGAAAGNDQNTIWLIGWGENKVYGIYPKGSQAGLSHRDMGIELTNDGLGSNAEFPAFRDYFSWKCGFAVEDARYLVRGANVDSSALLGTGSTIIDLMNRMCEQIQDTDNCRPVFYMNRFVRGFLRRQMVDTIKNSTLTWENVGGKPVLHFSGIPIHRTDALLSTEAPLV